MKFFATFAVLSIAFQISANASLITFDLRDPSGTGGTAGEALEANGFVTIDGVTLTVAVTPGFGESSASFNALSSQAGVDTDGVSSATDDSDGIDGDDGEELSFTVTFNGAQISSVSLAEVDLAGVGSASGGDAGLITQNSTLIATLETGVSGFNGSTDVWTPPSTISVSSGDVFIFGAEANIGIQTITFDVTAVPEPSPLLFSLIAICGAGIFYRLKRKRVDAA